MPPYLLAVVEEACENSWNSFPHLLRRHANASVSNRELDPVAAVFLSLASSDRDSAFLGELIGVARQVEQGLPKTGLVGVDRTEVRWAIDDEAVAVLRRHRLNCLSHVLDHGHQRERFEMKLHAPRLDLRQVENIVDCIRTTGGFPPAFLRLPAAITTVWIWSQHLRKRLGSFHPIRKKLERIPEVRKNRNLCRFQLFW